MNRSFKHATTGVLFVRGVPAGTKTLFKAACVRRNLSMTDVLTALMKMYVKKPSCVKVVKGAARWLPPPELAEEVQREYEEGRGRGRRPV